MSTPNHPKPETEPATQGGPVPSDAPQAEPDSGGEEPVTLEDRASLESAKARHDEISRNIRAVSLALISYALFCFLTLGQSDDIAFRETGKLQIPFSGGIDIGFSSFFVVGPLILIVLTFYLHIFIHELNKCELEASRKLPFVFNLDNGFARGITFFLFYFLTPIVFLSFIWSIRASYDVTFWSAVALAVSLLLVWQFHRASPASRRSLRQQPIPLMILVGVFIVSAVPGNLTFFGPIELAKSDLKNTSFKNYVLDRLNADSANLEFADFSGNQYVKDALFSNAALMNANFSGANLQNSRFRKSNLTRAVLRGASLMDAGFQEARLIDADLSPLSVFKKKEESWFPFLDLPSVPKKRPEATREQAHRLSLNPLSVPTGTRESAEGAPLPKPDAHSAQPESLAAKTPVQYNTRLDGAAFHRALLLKTNLTAARLDRARFIDAEITSAIFNRTQGKSADFTGARIRESIFDNAILESAQFIETEILDSRFNEAALTTGLFQNATLMNVNFTGADLSRSNFYETVFENVNFTNAVLEQSDLSNHNLYQVRFEETNLRQAALDLANMTGNTVINSDFTRATLSGVSFYDAQMTGSRFTDADLDSADFRGADLMFVDFRGAHHLLGPRGRANPTLKQADHFQNAMYDDDVRKALGISDKTLLNAIVLFVDYHYSQDEKQTELEKLKAFYGLSPRMKKRADLTLAPFSRNPDAQSRPLLSPPESSSP